MTTPPFEDLYYETDRPVRVRGCDHPGCATPGDYRAPKNRALTDYYFFCLDHVRAYNAAWDYFAGMSGIEIEAHVRAATVWERPSWPVGSAWKQREQNLRDEIFREFFSEESARTPAPPMPQAEKEALAALELAPPVGFADIKAQYRVLVKRHHPDLHGGSVEAEEKFKTINQAFAVLRRLYETDQGV